MRGSIVRKGRLDRPRAESVEWRCAGRLAEIRDARARGIGRTDHRSVIRLAFWLRRPWMGLYVFPPATSVRAYRQRSPSVLGALPWRPGQIAAGNAVRRPRIDRVRRSGALCFLALTATTWSVGRAQDLPLVASLGCLYDCSGRAVADGQCRDVASTPRLSLWPRLWPPCCVGPSATLTRGVVPRRCALAIAVTSRAGFGRRVVAPVPWTACSSCAGGGPARIRRRARSLLDRQP